VRFVALDMVLSLEELVGFGLSNRPAGSAAPLREPVAVVLVADRFPAPADPLVELAESLERARVEVAARPATVDLAAARRLRIDYLEDDGVMARLMAILALASRHPWRLLLEAGRRAGDDPPLHVLAPAARRLHRDAGARLHALGGERSQAIAERLARLLDRPVD
jgi:hypothetical protein